MRQTLISLPAIATALEGPGATMTTLPSSPEESNPRSPLLNLLIMVTLATVVVAMWYLGNYYLRGSSDDVTWYPPSAPCDLHQGACVASLGMASRLSLDFDGELRELEILPIEVHLDNVEARAVTVELVGRNMHMGVHRFILDAQGNGVFRGDAQIGICTEAVMPWRAQVVIETPDGRKGSWFDFDIKRSAV